MSNWIQLALVVVGAVGGMTLIERSTLYDPPKRGLQAVIAIAVGAVVLRFVGII